MTKDRSKDPPRSAADLIAELQRDPAYVARNQQRVQQQILNVESYTRAAAPLLKDLAANGFPVRALRDLRENRGEYQAAIPLRHAAAEAGFFVTVEGLS